MDSSKTSNSCRKRYRLIADDIEELLAEMESRDYRGDFMLDVSDGVFKVRLKQIDRLNEVRVVDFARCIFEKKTIILSSFTFTPKRTRTM